MKVLCRSRQGPAEMLEVPSPLVSADRIRIRPTYFLVSDRYSQGFLNLSDSPSSRSQNLSLKIARAIKNILTGRTNLREKWRSISDSRLTRQPLKGVVIGEVMEVGPQARILKKGQIVIGKRDNLLMISTSVVATETVFEPIPDGETMEDVVKRESATFNTIQQVKGCDPSRWSIASLSLGPSGITVISSGDDGKTDGPTTIIVGRSKNSSGLGVGVIGAGSFAQTRIFPTLARLPNVTLRGVASASGFSAHIAANRYGFHFSTTDYRAVLNDQDTRVVFIVSRPKNHPEMLGEAFHRPLCIYVEKPLSINADGLRLIQNAFSKEPLPKLFMVGFNRRSTTALKQMRDFFQNRAQPVLVHLSINGAYRPPEHWAHDQAESGERIVFNACHFVDAVRFVVDRKIVWVNAVNAGNELLQDHLNIQMKFEDGSAATILYTAYGDRRYVSERMEIIGDRKVAVHENFQRLILAQDGRVKRIKIVGEERGHELSIKNFLAAATNHLQAPVTFDAEIHLAEVMFKIRESFLEKQPKTI